ncbi:MAG: ABC transporter substrate-binding protein [Sphaerochaetaceae bacterium]
MKIRRYISMCIMMIAVSVSLCAQGVQEMQKVKIGILPDVDSLPFMLADFEQLFDEEGVEVELVMFQSPVERDAAFQARQVDGIVADTLGAFFLEQAGFDISIVSVTDGRYGIAASPNGEVSSLDELAGKDIGISSNTIIEYLADTLVSRAGVDSQKISLVAVPKIPVRMELLLNDQIPAACLPEPLYTQAVLNGAKPLGDSTSLSDAPGVMLFDAQFVTDHTEDLAKVFRAYQRAGQLINADNDAYRSFLVDHAGFSEQVAGVFSFVTYSKIHLPTEDQIENIAQWMSEHELLDTVPSYDDLIDTSVLQSL